MILVLLLLLLLHATVCQSLEDNFLPFLPPVRNLLEEKGSDIPVHFGICIPVGYRSIDPDFLLLARQSLGSILNQTYTNFTIIVALDCLSPENVTKVESIIKQLDLPPGKIIVHNLEEANSIRAIFAEAKCTVCNLRNVAAVAPLNLAYSIAESLPHITHIKPFGDDDTMRSMHLDRLRQAYQVSSKIAFAYTTATHSHHPGTFPKHGRDHNFGKRERFVNHLPLVRVTFAMTISWNLLWLRGKRERADFEQIALRKSWGEVPKWVSDRDEKSCQYVIAHDAFGYLELRHHINASQSILDTKVSIDYLASGQRSKLVRAWYAERESPVAVVLPQHP